jgi:exopolysaccharide biosynthesis polyprenyl glycosylphosphotransferase
MNPGLTTSEAGAAGHAARLALPLGTAQRRTILVGGDLVIVCALTAVALRLGAARSGWDWSAAFLRSHWPWFVVLGTLWLVLAWANGLYDPRRWTDRWAAAVLSVQVSAQVLLVWALAYFVPPPWTLVRHVVVFFTLGAALLMPLWRQVYAAVVSRAAFRRRVLIIGAGLAGRTLLEALRHERSAGFEVLGFADDAPSLAGTVIDGVRVVTDRHGLVATARRLGATELVLAVTHTLHGELFRALMDAREQGLVVTPMPVLYEEVTGRVPVEHIADHWAVALPLDTAAARGLYPLARRSYDLILALLGAGVLVLVLVIVGPVIRLTSPGPIFYRQERVGWRGRLFTLLKLRTMMADAEPDGPVWAARDDPRVTTVGRWLRRTRLDELPQVINILRGDMSVVGPRPERPEFVALLAEQIPFYRARHAIRPGLTGWATIHQGYASSTADALLKLQYDLYYLKHQSLVVDAAILLRTLAMLLRLGGR